MFDQFVNVVQSAGGDMPFNDMIAQIRAQGGRPELWLRAKHAGVIQTYLDNGVLRVRLPQAQPEGGE